MKRTELERRVRQLKRDQKHAEYIERVEGSRESRSVAAYIDELFEMLYYNDQEVMNIPDNIEIFELFEELKEDHPEKQRSEELTSELQSRGHLVCRLLLEKTETVTE